MALKRLTIDGYGQVELNNCAFRRDGRIEAQCKPNATDFATDLVENGMILAVDNVAREVKYATDGSLPVALVYSAEHIYDERTPGLKSFALKGTDDFYPRLGYLSVGDKWTTNTVCYDDSEFNDDTLKAALEAYATTPVYGGISANGAVKLSATAPSVGPKLRVIEYTTMPNGTVGIKLQCYVA